MLVSAALKYPDNPDVLNLLAGQKSGSVRRNLVNEYLNVLDEYPDNSNALMDQCP